MEESKKKLDILEEWITAYDEPIPRSSLSDIFYDLKDEIEYWQSMYTDLLKESENDYNHLKNSFKHQTDSAIRGWETVIKYKVALEEIAHHSEASFQGEIANRTLQS